MKPGTADRQNGDMPRDTIAASPVTTDTTGCLNDDTAKGMIAASHATRLINMTRTTTDDIERPNAQEVTT